MPISRVEQEGGHMEKNLMGLFSLVFLFSLNSFSLDRANIEKDILTIEQAREKASQLKIQAQREREELLALKLAIGKHAIAQKEALKNRYSKNSPELREKLDEIHVNTSQQLDIIHKQLEAINNDEQYLAAYIYTAAIPSAIQKVIEDNGNILEAQPWMETLTSRDFSDLVNFFAKKGITDESLYIFYDISYPYVPYSYFHERTTYGLRGLTIYYRTPTTEIKWVGLLGTNLMHDYYKLLQTNDQNTIIGLPIENIKKAVLQFNECTFFIYPVKFDSVSLK